jgi:hypothetical protein
MVHGGLEKIVAKEREMFNGTSALADKLGTISTAWGKIQMAMASPIASEFSEESERAVQLLGKLEVIAEKVGQLLIGAGTAFANAIGNGTFIENATTALGLGLLKTAGVWLAQMLENVGYLEAALSSAFYGVIRATSIQINSALSGIPGLDSLKTEDTWSDSFQKNFLEGMSAMNLGDGASRIVSNSLDKWVSGQWDDLLRRNGVKPATPYIPQAGEAKAATGGKSAIEKPQRFSDSMSRVAMFLLRPTGGTPGAITSPTNYARTTAQNAEKQTRILQEIALKIERQATNDNAMKSIRWAR